MNRIATRPTLTTLLPLAALLVLPCAAAQVGPFVDGEVVVMSPGSIQGRQAIYRIDPTTGHGELLLDDIFPNYSESGWAAFDPYRNRLLAYLAWFPSGPTSPELFSIAEDGTLQPLGFNGEKLRSLAPTGDGRVYCNRDDELHVITANSELLPVLDLNGEQFERFLDHLIYDPPTNSLIGVAAQAFASPCWSTWSLQSYRIPLDATGTQLASPAVCSNYPFYPALHYPIGLDPLPNGNYLVTFTNVPFPSQEVFLELDPNTLLSSIWSTSTLSDVNGGVYSPLVGKAVTILDNNMGDEMRLFSQGQGGGGTTLNVDVPIGDGTTGVSTGNLLTDIDTIGSSCGGSTTAFGTGTIGTGGIVPTLHTTGCPRIGATFNFEVWNAVPQSLGLVAVATTSTSIPLFGGTAYVLPPYVLELPFVTEGLSGVAGDGTASVPQPVPADPALAGIVVFAQAGIIDSGAPQGISLTNAIELKLE